jgi:ubiquinone/menaquinone biosynthesis C-methylase UbiE
VSEHLLGRVITTPAAAAALAGAGVEVDGLLRRYQHGEWGDEPEITRGLNDFMVEHGLAVFSTYTLPGGEAVVLITTADRNATHVMTPAEAAPEERSAEAGYAAWSKTYDAELNQLIMVEQPLVEAIVDRLSLRTALDAAAGTGRHTLALAQRGVAVTAFDATPEMLAVARRRLSDAGLSAGLVRGTLTGPLPLADEAFDLAVCALAFCHLPDLAAVCRELFRVVRPGGGLLVTDFHPDAQAFGWRTIMWDGPRRYLLTNYQHTREVYLAAVEQAGFVLREVRDLPVAEIPADKAHPLWQREYGSLNYCLLIHAEKA